MGKCEGKFLIKNNKVSFKEFGDDYYESLKKYRKEDFSQIAITAYIFLEILEKKIRKYSDRSFCINDVHLGDNADGAQQEINDRIMNVNPCSHSVASLLEVILLLKDITSNESVEIEYVTYSFEEKEEDTYVTLHNTGYVEYDGPKNKVELIRLGKMITGIRHGE
ncbi:hypothetical protein ACI3E1_07575 [Ligilactobacillus sp. LYQ139]|uniref:hypothetical protein n=1 Tax=Ligilactobacillus sp. LYQ139 TaxID=3378800 RepID=UPI0038547CD8